MSHWQDVEIPPQGTRWALFTDDELDALESWYYVTESEAGPLEPAHEALRVEIRTEIDRRAD